MKAVVTESWLRIRGAKQHNLKNISVDLPRNKLIVFTGVSGSGKSSLAFDTIYAEGQRRYIESLSAYARQFLGQKDKPDVELIEGLSPAISVDQKTTSKNPRSTVGTVTEIYDLLRVLWARIGVPHCPECGQEIKKMTVQDMVDKILTLPEGVKILVEAPIIVDRKGEYRKLLSDLLKQGFIRVRVDRVIYDQTNEIQDIKLDRYKKHNINVIVDRLVLTEDIIKRLTDSTELALRTADGKLIITWLKSEEETEDLVFSEEFGCATCGISFSEIEPRMFSFNNPMGACSECGGLGYKLDVDPNLIITNPEKSIMEGALMNQILDTRSWRYHARKAVADHYGFSLDTPFKDLGSKIRDVFLYGSGKEKIKFEYGDEDSETHWKTSHPYEGLINGIRRRHRQTKSEGSRKYYERFMSKQSCQTCKGEKLRPEALAVTIAGKNISEAVKLSAEGSYEFFDNLQLSKRDEEIAREVLKEIKARLSFLLSVGLNYLTLERRAVTLSGGESQRIRLATQIGSALVGVLYILDEPSIGLHQRDKRRLLRTLENLRDMGNTIIVVEHDEETIETADFILDLGPGAGVHGGEVVAQGSLEEIKRTTRSLTGKYFSGEMKIEIPAQRRQPQSFLTIKGAKQHNLKNINVQVPIGVMTCVTGVSGSGKSSLINETLYKALARTLHGAHLTPGVHDDIEGVSYIDKVINVDQSPIGRTPRSNPATYVKVFDDIRKIFAQTKESKARGYKPGRFSFNVKGGRCETCRGGGKIKIEMHFLPDVWIECEACKGKRYNRETLEIKFKEKNISQVLDMNVDQALEFFENIPSIKKRLQTLHDVGLGYIKLGQSATTLSGGEAQRVKLAKELSRKDTGSTLYILDEPTTGLHFYDIQYLLDVLNRLTDAGNTVVIIEHNMDVIKNADWIIDLGPEGGDAGGYVLVEGYPEDIIKNIDSSTGQYLTKILNGESIKENVNSVSTITSDKSIEKVVE